MAFCDYCECETCREGASYISHAKTNTDRWICDVCYDYEECLKAGDDPCEEECCHRPVLISEFTKEIK